MRTDHSFIFNQRLGLIYANQIKIGYLNIAERRIFTALAQTKNEIISREQLIDDAWPNKNVTPNSLNMAIKSIRSIFMSAGYDDVITTHSKKGFSWNDSYPVNFIDVDEQVPEQKTNDTPTALGEPLPAQPPSSVLSKKPLPLDTFRHTMINAILPRSKRALYYSAVTSLILIIILEIIFYLTQTLQFNCEIYQGASFCGVGSLPYEHLPSDITDGEYIYVIHDNNASDGNDWYHDEKKDDKGGFHYVRVK